MILITGITGKSGKWFLNKIIDNHHFFKDEKFIFVVRNKELDNIKNLDLINYGIEKGSLEDLDFLNSIMSDVTVVFHIANIHFSENVLKAAINNNVKRIVFVHTTGIYSKYKSASNEYIEIEAKVKKIANKNDITFTILQPTMIFGNRDDNNMSVFIKMVDSLPIFPMVNTGKYLLQPVHEKDLGYAYYSVLANLDETKNKTYVLSGKDPIYFVDVIRKIAKYLDKKSRLIYIPSFFVLFLFRILYIVSFTKYNFIEKAQRLTEDRNFDHDLAKNDFGYLPRSFDYHIKRQVDEYLNIKSS